MLARCHLHLGNPEKKNDICDWKLLRLSRFRKSEIGHSNGTHFWRGEIKIDANSMGHFEGYDISVIKSE